LVGADVSSSAVGEDVTRSWGTRHKLEKDKPPQRRGGERRQEDTPPRRRGGEGRRKALSKNTTMAVNDAQGEISPPPTQVRFEGSDTFILPVRAVCRPRSPLVVVSNLLTADTRPRSSFGMGSPRTTTWRVCAAWAGANTSSWNRTTSGFEAEVDSGPIPSTTTTVCSLRMMTPPLTLTTAMQIAAAYGGDEL